jgi:hypothetical protein
MDKIGLDRKMKLEYEAYENDMKFGQFSEDKKDLILAIKLGDFKLKLENCDIRNAVKHEICQAVLRYLNKKGTLEWRHFNILSIRFIKEKKEEKLYDDIKR